MYTDNPKFKRGNGYDDLKYVQAYQKRNPEKTKAQKMLNNRLASGKIQRQPCEVCGTTKKVQAHHDDYSKPLAVRWLCRKHHREFHGLQRKAA